MGKLLILIFICTIVQGLIANPKTRIRGGQDIDIKDVPYHVSLRLRQGTVQYHCGGSILDKRHVLTAAHCINILDKNLNPSIIARFGTNFRQQGGIKKMIEAYLVHPKFNAVYLDYDFGVVRVDSDIEFGDTIAPVHLPTDDGESLGVGQEFRVVGWGQTGHAVEGPRHLQGLVLPLIDIKKCDESWVVTRRMICIAGEKDGVQMGAALGDSGGGLVSVDPNTDADNRIIYGVSSFSKVGKPSGFARVSVALDWINGILDGSTPLTPM